MGFAPGMWEALLVFGLFGVGVLVPLALVVLLIIWLVNKKRRDTMMIESLIGIKQTLDEIRERLSRLPEDR